MPRKIDENTISNLLELITPINLEEEKEKFLYTDNYNPQFKYIWEDNTYSVFSRNKRKNNLFKSIVDQDYKNIYKSSKKVFDIEFEDEFVDQAQDATNISFNEIKYIERISKDEIAKEFKDTLKYFDVAYDLIFTESSAYNFRPKYKDKQILIGNKAHRSLSPHHGQIKHEFTHIIRSENQRWTTSKYHPYFLTTDEGLACYFQDYMTKLGHISLYNHAIQYLATSIGLKGSFVNLYDYFREVGYSKELSWRRAARHKFGFKDTSQPGDILKPAMYFHHEQKIKILSDKDKLKLFNGKVSYKRLEKIKEYTGKIPKELILEFFFKI